MENKIKKKEFSKIRAALWPIHKSELKKFIPMTLLMGCMVFDYNMLRGTKDSLMIPLCGAEIISALKLWAVLPSAIIFMLLYSKLANSLSKQALFYTISSIFIGFFVIFALFLYPNHKILHPDVSDLIEEYPRFKWMILVLGNWTFSLYYIMSELWGGVMLNLMFWQFANDITPVTQARRFYALLGIVGNLSVILSGIITKEFSLIRTQYPEEVDVWGITINWLVITVVIVGILGIFIYWWMHKFVINNGSVCNLFSVNQEEPKVKLCVSDSLKYILTSKYVGCIALLVISYGISINLVEGIWKSQINVVCHGNSNEYSAFMGQFQIYIGIATVVCYIIGVNILRLFSWLTAAVLTPIIIFVTGGAFFMFVIFSEQLEPKFAAMGVTAVMMAVILGQIQNIVSKSTKYAVFDATKEMSYIPLDDELKMKGKAAVDVVCGRLGKGSGAFIQWILLFSFTGSDLISLAPTISVMFISVIALWIFAAYNLNEKFVAITSGKFTNKQAI